MTEEIRTRTNPLIVITSTTEKYAPEKTVRDIIEAIQIQVTRDFKPAWGIDAEIVYAKKGKEYPNAYRINIRATAGEENKGYLGYHFSENGYPVASIFAEEDLKDDKTISDTLSHEVLEMLVDPACNLYAHRAAAGLHRGPPVVVGAVLEAAPTPVRPSGHDNRAVPTPRRLLRGRVRAQAR